MSLEPSEMCLLTIQTTFNCFGKCEMLVVSSVDTDNLGIIPGYVFYLKGSLKSL